MTVLDPFSEKGRLGRSPRWSGSFQGPTLRRSGVFRVQTRVDRDPLADASGAEFPRRHVR